MHGASEPVSPPTIDVVEPVPSLDGDVVEDDEPEPFEEGPVEFSPLPLYPNNIVRHIWDEDVALVGFILFYLHLF